MTTLHDHTRRLDAMPAGAGPETAPHGPAEPPRRPGRTGVLLGAAVTLAGVATVIGLTVPAPPAPLPPVPVPPPGSSATCTAGSCEGLDPTAEGCQQDARTVADRVVTARIRGVEVPVGAVELRASAACRAVWARYAVDPTAPVGEIAVEGGDGRVESAPVDAVVGHPHVGYGTTPMLAGSDGVRAAASPTPGGELPSSATSWISGGGAGA